MTYVWALCLTLERTGQWIVCDLIIKSLMSFENELYRLKKETK